MAPLYPWQYLSEQWRTLPSVSSFADPQALTGKTVIVTGANTGLGLEAARHLARLWPKKLILACRDPLKGQAAALDVRNTTGCLTVESWELDLASFESVRRFAGRFGRETDGKLHVLIANAAVSYPTYQTTENKWESMLKVNHIGTAHLILSLLPYMLAACPSPPPAPPAASSDPPASAPSVPSSAASGPSQPPPNQRKPNHSPQGPRLVVVSSEIHYWVYDHQALTSEHVLKTLNDEERCQQWGVISKRYGATKMLNILFTRSLSQRLSQLTQLSPPSPGALTANTVNPGFCHSSLTRHMSTPALTLLKSLAARTTEVGSRTLVHAALAPELEGVSGVYLSACEVREEGDFVLSEEGGRAGEKVWKETLEVLFGADPGLRERLEALGLDY